MVECHRQEAFDSYYLQRCERNAFRTATFRNDHWIGSRYGSGEIEWKSQLG
jgi:hypothetical protein